MTSGIEDYPDASLRQRLSKKIASQRENLAYTDDLTGLFNHRLLSQLLFSWWPDLVQEADQLCLIILDLDGFKAVNDTQGHLIGDDVLRRVSILFRKMFRKGDVIVRYGGDEFVILLPETTAADATAICKRVREALTRQRFQSQRAGADVDLQLSFSFGVASYPDDADIGETVLEVADQRLYEDKRRRKSAQTNLSRPQRYRNLLLRVLALLVLAAVAISLLIYFTRTARSPVPVLPVAGRREQTDPSWKEREAALVSKIKKLQEQVEVLSDKTDTGDEADDQQAVAQIADLKTEIKMLQKSLEKAKSQNAPPPEQVELQAESQDFLETAEEAFPEVRETRESLAPSEPAPADPLRIVPPVKISEPPKKYPYRAKLLRKEAVVYLRVLVDKSGEVVKVEQIGEPVGYGFDEEAKRVARLTTYVPGTVDGLPEEMEKTITVKFEL